MFSNCPLNNSNLTNCIVWTRQLPFLVPKVLLPFHPNLSAIPVRFPRTKPEFCFVIAQTFFEAVKHTTAPIHYNLRAVECSLVAVVLFRLAGLESPLLEGVKAQRVTLREFQCAYFDEKNIVNTFSEVKHLDQIVELLKLAKKKIVKEEGYTREEIASLLCITEEELERRFMTQFPVRAERFKLRQRAIHVFNEASRVQHFMKLLKSSTGQIDLGKNLGAL